MKKNTDVDAEISASTVYEDSEVPYYNPPYQNEFEKAKWNSKGFDQSGMK